MVTERAFSNWCLANDSFDYRYPVVCTVIEWGVCSIVEEMCTQIGHHKVAANGPSRKSTQCYVGIHCNAPGWDREAGKEKSLPL